MFPKNIKSYLTIAIDEIDFYAVEEYSGDEPPDKNRLVAGYQLGTEIYNLFRIKGFNLVLEGVFLDKWLYNYPNDGSRDLTYTYYDKVSFPEKRQFYRFIGHYLGSNATGLFIDLSYKNVALGYQYIDQGEVFIFEPAFSEREEVVSEYKNIFLCQFKNQYLNDKIEIAVNLNYSNIQNYHNQKGVDTKIPEFWINFRYRLLYLEDIFY